MTPYYDENGITIYHGDCREMLPGIDEANVDLLLTDPPYGINYRGAASGRWGRPFEGQTIHGDTELFDPEHILRFRPAVIWGVNHFAHLLPPNGGRIVWSKVQDNRFLGFNKSYAEIAWTDLHNHVSLFNCFWQGSPMYRTEERGRVLHPTQKPVSLMKWIVGEWTEPNDLVLDPYMGSGPVAQACHEMGRRYVGIEIEEKYCEIAVQRLAQGVLEFS